MPGTNFNAPQGDIVQISLTDEAGLATVGVCTGLPAAVALEVSRFKKGCILTQLDAVAGSGLWVMTGTTASPAWTAINTAAPASITLTNAHVMVGNGANVATDVAMTGDVTTTNAGVTAIGAGKVLLANLGTGIAPAYIVKYAGKKSDAGGNAVIAISATGVLTSDLILATLEASTNVVYLVKAVPTADTVTVTLSGDPGAATKINWCALRLAA